MRVHERFLSFDGISTAIVWPEIMRLDESRRKPSWESHSVLINFSVGIPVLFLRTDGCVTVILQIPVKRLLNHVFLINYGFKKGYSWSESNINWSSRKTNCIKDLMQICMSAIKLLATELIMFILHDIYLLNNIHANWFLYAHWLRASQ